ncbi:unnamed protein product (macronuclear) [Paramecium tetraurelia]|uniref:Poly [ADP-ribose] polymerase n=1 Tax=Paramecium tetraurelia TaxID=5888 RepID=A0DM45_PARTE|nr:uncharacterized protein GSPATT00018330001 [Paramecium tetraurelia]CAK84112.1 unnamed protein product [Paramecium tetraurelia]|eukprot:XP_001451509.1 hypothetical protein (macronuclear) [Paramecium tetraurelia strain d4-2]
MPPKRAQSKAKKVIPVVTAKGKKDAKAAQKNTKVVAKQTPKSVSTGRKGSSAKSVSPAPPAKSATKNNAKSSSVSKKDATATPAKKDVPDKKKTQKKSPSPPPNKKVQKEKTELKTITFTGSAPVDEFVHQKDTYVVYEQGGKIYDCAMNQTNIMEDNNNNKFYFVQLLKKKNENAYFVFTRWGRVGQIGQLALQPFQGDLSSAISQYQKKIHEKSVKGDYRILEKDYSGENDPKALEKLEKLREQKEKESFNKSKLHQRVKELIRLIFDMKMMNNQMREIGYDAKKMPLGKLAATTIKKGFDVLKQIQDELDKKNKNVVELQRLTSEFYSQIPHDFGMNKAPLIDTKEKVKAKLEMLEAIQHIQVATKILEDSKDDSNVIDENYKKLNIDLKYLDHNSEKVKTIKKFIQNTQGYYKLEVEDVFELTKDQDDKRFKKDLGNRMLLWHGSRLTNFVGILGQGLRIAPPEAPVTGYRFGKGVYLADVVEKSASYCCPDPTTKTGLILLCDVALGNPNIKLDSDHNASNLPKGKHCTWGKARSYPPEKSYVEMPGLPGVKVPIGKPEPSDVEKKSGLWHNEFIVYDVAQVRLKYLIKMKWQN